MLKKQKVYHEEGMKVISVFPVEKPTLDEVLTDQLERYLWARTEWPQRRGRLE
jgi:hypothetical protein